MSDEMVLNVMQRQALAKIRKAGEGLTEEQVTNDKRFQCILWQQTIGPMAMNLIYDCIDMPVEEAIQLSEYNEPDVMFSVLKQSLDAWIKENRNEIQDW
jgi:hypothetical protein